jgi:hypothetical protein
LENIGVERPDLRDKPWVFRILQGRWPVAVGWRRGEPRELPLVHVIGADNDVEVRVAALSQMSPFLGQELLQAGDVHDAD